MPTRGTLYLVPNLLGICRADRRATRPHDRHRAAHRSLRGRNPESCPRFPEDAFARARDRRCRHRALRPEGQRARAMRSLALAGVDVGVVSDAGCPGMATPAPSSSPAHRFGAPVVPLVGPSSVLLGLMASGFDGQHFSFHGYLPSKPIERDKALKALERPNGDTGATQLFIETPTATPINARRAHAGARWRDRAMCRAKPRQQRRAHRTRGNLRAGRPRCGPVGDKAPALFSARANAQLIDGQPSRPWQGRQGLSTEPGPLGTARNAAKSDPRRRRRS